MRQITFKGFLKNYVYELSDCKSYSLMNLARESAADNPRLREPLLLHALFSYDREALLRLLRPDAVLLRDYVRYFDSYRTEQALLGALESRTSELPLAYKKVFKSYLSVKSRYVTDNRTKALMRDRMLQLQQQKGVSAYRVYGLKIESGKLSRLPQ